MGHSPDQTMYELDICGVGKQEQFQMISYSGPEVIPSCLEGPTTMFMLPATIGSEGGIAKLEFSLSDGSLYKMELPWGAELKGYIKGDR